MILGFNWLKILSKMIDGGNDPQLKSIFKLFFFIPLAQSFWVNGSSPLAGPGFVSPAHCKYKVTLFFWLTKITGLNQYLLNSYLLVPKSSQCLMSTDKSPFTGKKFWESPKNIFNRKSGYILLLFYGLGSIRFLLDKK